MELKFHEDVAGTQGGWVMYYFPKAMNESWVRL